MAHILFFDSDFDDVSKMVAEWRRQHLYPRIQGHSVKILKGNTANRAYLAKELIKKEITFFSGSGHGLFDEFQGSDGTAALKLGGYNAAEVSGKIIHLLSCYTAFELGADLVLSGCIGFFGYDVPFSFFPHLIADFMAPDAELDTALADGKSAEEAHTLIINTYDQKIDQLESAGDLISAADMAVNRDHLCSPVKDSRWGSISGII